MRCKMKQILCSTGAFIVKANGQNHKLLDSSAKRLKFDGYEFMMSSRWYENIDHIITEVNQMGLYIPAFHSDKHIGEKISRNEEGDLESALHLFEINCQVALALKANQIVLHLWGGIQSDRNIENNIAAYRLLKSISDKYDLCLTIENVVCNQKDPMTRLQELYNQYPDVLVTYDTKMAAFHNQISLLYSDEYKWMWDEKRIHHFHINDYSGGYMDWKNLKTAHIGKGNIDFTTFFDFLNKNAYQGDFTLEATAVNENGDIDFESLNQSYQQIKDYIR